MELLLTNCDASSIIWWFWFSTLLYVKLLYRLYVMNDHEEFSWGISTLRESVKEVPERYIVKSEPLLYLD